MPIKHVTIALDLSNILLLVLSFICLKIYIIFVFGSMLYLSLDLSCVCLRIYIIFVFGSNLHLDLDCICLCVNSICRI